MQKRFITKLTKQTNYCRVYSIIIAPHYNSMSKCVYLENNNSDTFNLVGKNRVFGENNPAHTLYNDLNKKFGIPAVMDKVKERIRDNSEPDIMVDRDAIYLISIPYNLYGKINGSSYIEPFPIKDILLIAQSLADDNNGCIPDGKYHCLNVDGNSHNKDDLGTHTDNIIPRYPLIPSKTWAISSFVFEIILYLQKKCI